jgi:hypothetical protein
VRLEMSRGSAVWHSIGVCHTLPDTRLESLAKGCLPDARPHILRVLASIFSGWSGGLANVPAAPQTVGFPANFRSCRPDMLLGVPLVSRGAIFRLLQPLAFAREAQPKQK